MKLSELVNLHNRLSECRVFDICREANTELSKITLIAEDQNLNNSQKTILDSFSQFEATLDKTKQLILDQIRSKEKIYLQNSYRDYENEKLGRYKWFDMVLPDSLPPDMNEQYEIRNRNVQDHVEHILSKQLDISKTSQDLLQIRIQRYSGWQNSAMVIHPGKESWIELMVSNDPLYLIDQHHDLLKPAMSKYNEVYQRRLRTYIIREELDQEILSHIPNNQFGLVLAYNYFDHRPFEIIQKYLTEIYTKIRPGGALLMTFNDCDRWPAVVAAERNIMCYTPGWMVRDWAQSLGFTIEFDWNENGTWSWLELRKPGKFQSVRGGQTLAKIMPK